MAVDWGFAWQVAAFGFFGVFAVLIVLAVVMWLLGLVLGRVGSKETGNNAKDKPAG